MSITAALLKKPTQDFKIEFDLGVSRQFALADVDGNGADQGAAPADDGAATPLISAFDAVTSVGSIGGSIEAGGFSAELTVPEFPCTFADFFETSLYLRAWHGGIPGVPGGAGVDPGRVLFLRGYMRAVESSKVWQGNTSRFAIKSTSSFLQEATFSRGIDYAAGIPHGAPGTSDDIIRHLVEYHTNVTPRSLLGIYLPTHDLDAFTLNEGSVLSMLKQLADNFSAGEGWVYCDREDNLQVTAHPNMVGAGNLVVNDPVLELDDDLVLEWSIPEVLPRQCAQVSIVASKSDQTEYVANYYGSSGLGSRDKISIRTDDTAMVDTLTARKFAHNNRRYRAVKAKVPLNIAVDLGNLVTVTTSLPQRGIDWQSKTFVCTAVSYSPDLTARTFVSELTLDECLF